MIHIVAHIYPGSISPESRSKCEFHLHPRLISSPSRPIDSHLASIQVVSHLNPGLYVCVPSSSRWRLSSNQVTKIASLFHPGNISNQSKSRDVRLASLQVLRNQHRGPNVLVSPPSMHHQCPNIRAACYLGLYHLHPSSENCMSVPSRHHPLPIQLARLVSHLHPGAISPEHWFQDSCLTVTQVTSQFHTNHDNNISATFRSHFKPLQVSRCASQIHLAMEMCGSHPSNSRLTSIQAPRFTPHLHPGHV